MLRAAAAGAAGPATVAPAARAHGPVGVHKLPIRSALAYCWEVVRWLANAQGGGSRLLRGRAEQRCRLHRHGGGDVAGVGICRPQPAMPRRRSGVDGSSFGKGAFVFTMQKCDLNVLPCQACVCFWPASTCTWQFCIGSGGAAHSYVYVYLTPCTGAYCSCTVRRR